MAGFEVIEVEDPRASSRRRSTSGATSPLAILDGEVDADEARAYEAALRDAGRPIPALTVVSPRTPSSAWPPTTTASPERVLHPPLLGRLDPLARRGDVHPARDRRRRQRPGPPGRRLRARRLERPRDDDRGVQPEGRRRQDDRRHQPRRRPPDAQGQVRPAHRCRHRDRPRHDLARIEARPDRRRQLARRGRGRPDREPVRHRRRHTRPGCASSP